MFQLLEACWNGLYEVERQVQIFQFCHFANVFRDGVDLVLGHHQGLHHFEVANIGREGTDFIVRQV